MPTYCLLLLAVLIVTGSAYEEERHRSNYKQPLNVKYASSNYQNTNLGPVLFPSVSNENGSPKSHLSPVLSSANGTQTSEVEYHMRVEDSSAVVKDEPIGPAFPSSYEPHVEYSPDLERSTARYEELAAAPRPPTEHYSHAHYIPHPDSRALTSDTHPLFGVSPAPSRLKSRKSFVRIYVNNNAHQRLDMWRKRVETAPLGWRKPKEELPPGHNESWCTWKSLNRLRTGVGRCKETLQKWGYSRGPATCECGEQQTMSHLRNCRL